MSIRSREKSITNHLRAIMRVMWDDAIYSEKDTEVFAAVLASVLRKVEKYEVRTANKEGLSYDTTVGIARYLIEEE